MFTRRHPSTFGNVRYGRQTQLLRTYELAKIKLMDLEDQRDKIEETITELRQQIQWGKELISSMDLTKRVQWDK